MQDEVLYRRYRSLSKQSRSRRWIGAWVGALFSFLLGSLALYLTSAANAPFWPLAVGLALGLSFGLIWAGTDFWMSHSRAWRTLPSFLFFFVFYSSEKLIAWITPHYPNSLASFMGYVLAGSLGFLLSAVPIIIWKTRAGRNLPSNHLRPPA
jgi:hypothetical protein